MEQGDEVLLGEPLEDEDLAAREEGRIDLEGGVLRGGADEDDAALLDIGKEGVLLGLVEAMDFVDEEDGAPAELTHPFGAGHDLLDFANAARDGAEIDELGLREVGDDIRKGCLADAGRPPEDHRGNLVLLDHRAKQTALADELLLTNKLVERFGAHAARKGLERLAFGLGGPL